MYDSNVLQSLYEHIICAENMVDSRLLWAIDEYKEKLEKQLPYCIHRPTKEFKIISTYIWAVEEVRNRIVFKNLKEALDEIRRLQDILESYDGRNKTSQKYFPIAACAVENVYDMLVEQFVL